MNLQTCKMNDQFFYIINSKWKFSIQRDVLKIRKHPQLDNFYADYEFQIVNGEIQNISNDEFPKTVREVIKKKLAQKIECGSGSWIVTRIADGSVIGEFYEWSNVSAFNPATCRVETALQYLERINRQIKNVQ